MDEYLRELLLPPPSFLVYFDTNHLAPRLIYFEKV